MCRKNLARRLSVIMCLMAGLVPLAPSVASAPGQAEKRDRFRTFFVARALGHEQFTPYLKAARPRIVQIGNYGAMFHGEADHERATGSPMMLPVVGEREVLAFQRKLNAQVHEMGLTVIGHFRLIKVSGRWKEKTGFVEYYNERWPEDLLGPRPHDDLRELLQRDANGDPIQLGNRNGELPLCLTSPHARRMLKRMLKLAIDHGVDGVITTFNYWFGCACSYCQDAFKQWLGERFTAEQVRRKLGIEDLASHRFERIPVRIPGYPDPETATELDWLAMEWGAQHFKRMFDDIFIDYGRSLKPDLIVATWNHLGNVSLKEERAMLPIEMWGRGEDYFWYSGGSSFVGENHDLSAGKVGDAWLAHLYIRELAGDKPFVMGKYERARLEMSMAEGYALGAIGMGRYMKFDHPVGFEVLVRYTRFREKKRGLYRGAARYADAALVLPRQSVLNRRSEALNAFRALGQTLVGRRVLIDVLADQKLSAGRLSRYPVIILPRTIALSDDQVAMLRQRAADGGIVLRWGEAGTLDEKGRPRASSGIEGAIAIDADDADGAAEAVDEHLRRADASVIKAPWTVRATSYTQPERVVLHLVNYDREAGAPHNNRTGPETERPEPVKNIAVDLRLPEGRRAAAVTLHAPERGTPLALEFQAQPGRVTFTVPRVRVYVVIGIETE